MPVLRDTRDLLASAVLSVGMFGFPVVLAGMQVWVPPTIEHGNAHRSPPSAQFVALAPSLLSQTTAPAPVPKKAPPAAEPPPAANEPAPAGVAKAPTAAPTPAQAVEGADPAAVPAQVATAVRGAGKRSGGQGSAVDATSNGKRGRRCAESDASVSREGKGRYRVGREVVDYYTADLDQAARLASVSWHNDGQGKRDGFKIRKMRCGTVLRQAGFRNGDVIHSVNGKRITTIPAALSAYRKLRRKHRLTIELTRDGQLVELNYRLI